jgi:hypothetical protein
VSPLINEGSARRGHCHDALPPQCGDRVLSRGSTAIDLYKVIRFGELLPSPGGTVKPKGEPCGLGVSSSSLTTSPAEHRTYADILIPRPVRSGAVHGG